MSQNQRYDDTHQLSRYQFILSSWLRSYALGF